MATAPYNHGVRVFDAGKTELPISAADLSSIGMAVVAEAADASKFPLNEPVHFYSNDTLIADLGATGTARAAIDAISDRVSSHPSCWSAWPKAPIPTLPWPIWPGRAPR